jgi:hypothetical protein
MTQLRKADLPLLPLQTTCTVAYNGSFFTLHTNTSPNHVMPAFELPSLGFDFHVRHVAKLATMTPA